MQLIEQVRGAIESSGLRPGDPLPGIRKVAAVLGINPNTVAKAYRQMQHADLITLRHGAGAFVAGSPSSAAETHAVAAGRGVIQRAVAELRELGLLEGAIRRLLESELAAPERSK